MRTKGGERMEQRTYSYRLKCTKQQREELSKAAGCARYVYNYVLGLIKAAREQGKKIPSRVEIDKMLPELKRATSWLKEPPSIGPYFKKRVSRL